jgi:ABC-type uncharacterized transport system substrate-binding protein
MFNFNHLLVFWRMLAFAPVLALVACAGLQAPPRTGPTVKVTPMPEAAQQPVRTAILISDDAAHYQLVAEEIIRRMPAANYEVFHFEGSDHQVPGVLKELESYAPDQLVAVGLLAARTARMRPGLPLVFCRVFDYQSNSLISSNSIGVKLLPPFDLQMEAWKALNPDLQNIGVIMGPHQEDLAREITTSAARHGIEVKTVTVGSDQEALFKFKRLVPAVEGMMILPDNRILSVTVLEELMAYGIRHRKQIVVFNDRLLKFGALMSITSNDGDVADQIIELMLNPRPSATAHMRLVPLTSMQVAFNAGVASELGLSASSEFQQFLNSD